MPFAVQRKGTKFVVVNRDTGRVLGTHTTEREARRQLRAIQANVRD